MKRFVAVPVWTLSLVLLLAFSFSQNSPKAIAQVEDPFGASTRAKKFEEKTSKDKSSNESPKEPRIWADDDYDHEANAVIRKKLSNDLTSAGLDFQDTALQEIVEYLRDEFKLLIQIDEQGLDDLGLASDEPVTVNLQNIKLGAALRFMLKPLELTTVIQDGMLIITSEDEALTCLKVAVYPVADLLSPDDLRDNSLVDVIVNAIAQETWAENGGGEAEIRYLELRGALVISQTGKVHEEILSLLSCLRKCEVRTELQVERKEVGGTYGGGSGHF